MNHGASCRLATHLPGRPPSLTIRAHDQKIVVAGKRGEVRVSDWISDVCSSDHAVTPVFGLVVKPAEGVSLYANRVEGLVPGATAAATANAGNGVLPVSNGGEVLSPFVSTQYELGGKLSLGKLNAGLALFQIDRDIAIYTPDVGRPGFLVYGPFGVQRHRGIELSVDAEPVDGLRIIAGGSIIDAKLRKTQGGVNQGNKPTGVPEYMLNANVEWDEIGRAQV